MYTTSQAFRECQHFAPQRFVPWRRLARCMFLASLEAHCMVSWLTADTAICSFAHSGFLIHSERMVTGLPKQSANQVENAGPAYLRDSRDSFLAEKENPHGTVIWDIWLATGLHLPDPHIGEVFICSFQKDSLGSATFQGDQLKPTHFVKMYVTLLHYTLALSFKAEPYGKQDRKIPPQLVIFSDTVLGP